MTNQSQKSVFFTTVQAGPARQTARLGGYTIPEGFPKHSGKPRPSLQLLPFLKQNSHPKNQGTPEALGVPLLQRCHRTSREAISTVTLLILPTLLSKQHQRQDNKQGQEMPSQIKYNPGSRLRWMPPRKEPAETQWQQKVACIYEVFPYSFSFTIPVLCFSGPKGGARCVQPFDPVKHDVVSYKIQAGELQVKS